MKSHLLLVMVVVLAFCLPVLAQRPPAGGTSGNSGGSKAGMPSFNNPNFSTQQDTSDLQVRIAWQQNERALDESVHVQLLNASNIPVQDTFSTRDGMVTFRAVSPGNYHLRLEGAPIQETVTDVFTINSRERMHMEWVHVMPKPNPQQASGPGGGLVSASELNVPSKAKSELDKGMEAFGKGDYKKAAEKLEKAIEIYPDYARAWNNLGVVHMKENDKAAAKQAFDKSIAVDDKFVPGYLNLGRLSMLEKNATATENYLSKALSIDPNNIETLALFSKEELLTGQYEKALAHARRVHTLPHDHLAEVHLIAGEALLHEGHSSEAVKEYEQYLKEYPDSPNAAKVRDAMAQIQAKKN